MRSLIESLKELHQHISACTNCSLSKTRTQVITGEGKPDAKILLLGEAPGGHEDQISGRVFTGKAGIQLQEFLDLLGLTREEIYLTNIVKCRPVKESPRGRYGAYANRTPKSAELKACRQWLDLELFLVKPKIIITLGAIPLTGLLDKKITMGETHGEPFFSDAFQAYIFPLFHPASIIYNQKIKPLYLADLSKLKTFLMEELTIHL